MRPNRWLVAIAFSSLSLAGAWLWFVPFFQAPDESAHADYVFALADVGHPYRLNDPIVRKDVTPQEIFLERRSGFYGVRYIDGVRPPVGYGSWAFFRAIDAAAPRFVGRVPPPRRAAPYVMFNYPVGYYVVSAVIMRAVAFGTGSLVAAYFAARAAGLLALLVAIACAFTIFRDTGCGTRQSLALTTAIGSFPMTTWVCASIQPDSFVFALVTLALVLTVRFRNAPSSIRLALALGATLGALALVKQQYAAITTFACLAATFASLSIARASSRRRSLLVIACAVPALVGFIVSEFATPVGVLQVPTALTPHMLAKTNATAAFAVETFVRHATVATIDAFVRGDSFHRFWNSFGWLDTPFYGASWGTTIVETSIGFLSLCVAIALLARQLRVFVRLARIARSGSLARATRLLASDVHVTIYLSWSSFLIFVFAFSDGSVSLQGRYWLPVIVPMCVILVRRVPALIPNLQLRRSSAIALTTVFVSYAIVSAPVALHAMRVRYYEPSYAASTAATVTAIDGVGILRPHFAAAPLVVDVLNDLIVRGWSIRSTDGRPVTSVEAVIDRTLRVRAKYGFSLPGSIGPQRVGFLLRYLTRSLRGGIHHVTIVSSTDAGHRDVFEDVVRFRVVASHSGN